VLASENQVLIKELIKKRPLLELFPGCTEEALLRELTKEEINGRDSDKSYWKPLIEELEEIRRDR
jgi:hypothetical protein